MHTKHSALRFLGILLGALVLVGLGATATLGAGSRVPSDPALDAATLRNPDGTLRLKAGASGALDLSGWNVDLDPQRGPVLSPAVNTWSALGNGVNNAVQALAISGSDLYVGGAFDKVCSDPYCDHTGLTVNHIVKWDGGAWSALGNGLNGTVAVIVVSGTDLYAGGGFSEICGNATCDSGNTRANRIAKWNGSSWSALGFGLNGLVRALAIGSTALAGVAPHSGSAQVLYAGGDFTRDCKNAICDTTGSVLYHVAKWDGSSWSPLGFGVDHFVFALAASGNDLYVGGRFAQVCGSEICTGNTKVNHIARWNGSTWAGLGNGVSQDVWALAANGSDLYVGGSFTRVCGNATCDSGNMTVNRVAKWNGTAWSPLGNGVIHQVDGSVFSLAMSGSDLYAGGFFTQICGDAACASGNTPANFIAKWNGSAWSAVGNGVDDQVFVVAASGSTVYAGGWFIVGCGNTACNSGNVVVDRIAKFVPAAPPTPTPTATATTVCAHSPNKPTLNSPPRNGTTNKTRPTLKWNAAACADNYTIVLKNAATNAQVTKKAGLTILHFKTKVLTHGATYKWWVKACNEHGCTKSPTWKFTVKYDKFMNLSHLPMEIYGAVVRQIYKFVPPSSGNLPCSSTTNL